MPITVERRQLFFENLLFFLHHTAIYPSSLIWGSNIILSLSEQANKHEPKTYTFFFSYIKIQNFGGIFHYFIFFSTPLPLFSKKIFTKPIYIVLLFFMSLKKLLFVFVICSVFLSLFFFFFLIFILQQLFYI